MCSAETFQAVWVRFPPFTLLHLFSSVTSNSSPFFWWPANSLKGFSQISHLSLFFFFISSFVSFCVSLYQSLSLEMFSVFLPLVNANLYVSVCPCARAKCLKNKRRWAQKRKGRAVRISYEGVFHLCAGTVCGWHRPGGTCSPAASFSCYHDLLEWEKGEAKELDFSSGKLFINISSLTCMWQCLNQYSFPN